MFTNIIVLPSGEYECECMTIGEEDTVNESKFFFFLITLSIP